MSTIHIGHETYADPQPDQPPGPWAQDPLDLYGAVEGGLQATTDTPESPDAKQEVQVLYDPLAAASLEGLSATTKTLADPDAKTVPLPNPTKKAAPNVTETAPTAPEHTSWWTPKRRGVAGVAGTLLAVATVAGIDGVVRANSDTEPRTILQPAPGHVFDVPQATATPNPSTSPSAGPTDIPKAPETGSLIPLALSAETLATLTPQEITSLFTIRSTEVSTPEQYVEAFLERQNALHNVGSAADFEENGIEIDATGQTYSLALNKKYILPALTGLYSVENDPDFVDQSLLWQANRKFVAILVGIPKYEAAITLSEGSLSITQTADGVYDIAFSVIHTDNLDATASMGDEERWRPYEATYNVAFTGMHVNDQGVWVAESWAQ